MSRTAFMWCLKSTGAAAVLASLAAVFLLGAETATAREMTHCQVKHSFCTQRCLMRGLHPEQENMCLKRTCDHQFNNCTRDSGESSTTSYEGVTPPKGVKPIRPGRGGRPLVQAPSSSPFIDSVLGNSSGLHQQGPSPMGTPASAPAAPAAPPVILR